MNEAVTSLGSIPWFGWVAIVAVVSGAVTKIVSMKHEHLERMAMIQAGINPNAKPPATQEV